MMFNRDQRVTRDRVKLIEARMRQVGYDDGYSGRRATSVDANYQQGWRRGREARRRSGDDAA